MFNSNSNFIMFAVYYEDSRYCDLFRPQAIFDDFSAALDFYDIERTGYIKNLESGRIIFSRNL